MESSTKKEEKQLLLDLRYLRMARIWAENSYCHRRKVGALVVKEKMIISDGYNGTPSGFENICEDDTNTTKPYVLHAEANAITKLARSSNNSDGARLVMEGEGAQKLFLHGIVLHELRRQLHEVPPYVGA
jgi:dCMP deaminase